MDHRSSLYLVNNGQKIPCVTEAVTDPCVLRVDISEKKVF